MSESFANLFEESYNQDLFITGNIVPATVIKIEKDFVYLDAGTKSEAYVDTNQFKNVEGELTIAIGDTVNMYLEMPVDGLGETRLSRDKAIRKESLEKLQKCFENETPVKGTVIQVVRGGLNMEIDKIRAFLPRSLADIRGADLEAYLDKPLEVKIVKFDQEKANLIVSRRALVEESTKAEKEEKMSKIAIGDKVKGTVKNLTNYGAFIDLDGLDGLLHVTDMSWKRINNPDELVEIGQQIEVVILKLDFEKARLSLGLKQLQDDPWTNIEERLPIGTILKKAVVSNTTEYGIFVTIEEAIDGLVHSSELSWTNKNANPSKMLQVGEEIDVKVIAIDLDRRRISLSIKQCTENPWEKFAENHTRGDRIVGPIRSKTDFGLFIGLEGGIDGLVHITDLSWGDNAETMLKSYKKKDEVEVVILSLDTERERISLGIKQLSKDAFSDYIKSVSKGSVVEGKVIEVDEKGSVVELSPEVTGILRKNEYINPVEKDEVVSAVITSIDKKNRKIFISMKAVDEYEEKSAIKEYKQSYKKEQNTVTNTIGDILGDSKNSEEN